MSLSRGQKLTNGKMLTLRASPYAHFSSITYARTSTCYFELVPRICNTTSTETDHFPQISLIANASRSSSPDTCILTADKTVGAYLRVIHTRKKIILRIISLSLARNTCVGVNRHGCIKSPAVLSGATLSSRLNYRTFQYGLFHKTVARRFRLFFNQTLLLNMSLI